MVSAGTLTVRNEPASSESERLYCGFWLRSKAGFVEALQRRKAFVLTAISNAVLHGTHLDVLSALEPALVSTPGSNRPELGKLERLLGVGKSLGYTT